MYVVLMFQNCAMMGVQSTCGKRKLEIEAEREDLSGGGGGTEGIEVTPCKAARWDLVPDSGATTPVTPADDCLARLRAVAAVPVDCGPWVHQRDEPLDDEDDWDDELSDYDEPITPQTPVTAPRQYTTTGYWHQQYYHHHHNHHHHHHHQQQHAPTQTLHHHHQQQQQTIRREENGKSYLELGPATTITTATTTTTACYRQRRLAVLNMSMFKLARYRQCSDPSLRRSVLICNTLRRIEREMERERERETPVTEVPPWYQSPPPTPAPEPEYGLREIASPSGRVTPFPQQPSSGDTINWGSVLSLTAEPLNNNLDAYEDEEPIQRPHLHHQPDTWDSFVHVLVSGT